MKPAFLVLAVLAMASPAWGQCVHDVPCSSDLPLIICSDPNTILIGDKCEQKGAGGGSGAFEDFPCPGDYAILAYSGTWTLVCARDLREPK